MTRTEFLALVVSPVVKVRPSSAAVVPPGTHPGLIFSASDMEAIRRRAAGGGMAGEAWQRTRQMAMADAPSVLSAKQAVGRDGVRLAEQIESMALVYQVEQNKNLGAQALAMFEQIASGIDPVEFHRTVDSDFFATEHWPKAFALAWDWLQPLMDDRQRARLLSALEAWNDALFRHTESWWWRDAGYNCGAIPVGAQGILLCAIRGESNHPNLARWFNECFRKISRNYFPETWRANGICNEGPGYAHYHKNPTMFADAVRRQGGPDLIASSGAVNAMHYLRHQWMPQGGCGPVGDNTNYGRRVFQPIYLFGIKELADAAGLWTWEKYADLDRINPLWVFLYWPDGLDPVSPGTLDLPTSHYFEIDTHRAGYLFARDRWDDELASWFVFTTRYNEANHSHYDMNSFMFTAFGEQFAAHENLFSYSNRHHGADLEHNMVIVDEGGMPTADRPTSAGDDGSILGLMTGVVAGDFADFARGDARASYADRSVRGSRPAVRAERTVLFVKQGPNPYIVVADDIQRSEASHDYHWQWYTRAGQLTGRGIFEEPFLFAGVESECRLAFHTPENPEHEYLTVKGDSAHNPMELGLLRVNLKGLRVRYLAVAAASRRGRPVPKLLRGPDVEGLPGSASIVVEGPGYKDLIVWQPESSAEAGTMRCGPLVTDALMAMVRTTKTGEVSGYVLGQGKILRYSGETLVRSVTGLSVSAGLSKTMVARPRRARQGLAPLPAAGEVRLTGPASRLWVDGQENSKSLRNGRMVFLDR